MIGVYTAICEEDKIWIDQYLSEIDRLNLDFAIHLDRVSPETKHRLTSHRHCIGFTENSKKEFTEQHKQGVFDIVASKGYEWGLAWDIDETWEDDFWRWAGMLNQTEFDYFDCRWINLWDNGEVRTDGAFGSGHRVKFYRLQSIEWRFTSPIVNGPKHVGNVEPKLGLLPLYCIHHGMKTKELRQLHKERWDRIYTAAVGKNPYGFWNFALDETITPNLVPYGNFISRQPR